MLYKVRFTENGHERVRYAEIPDGESESRIVDWYGLEESDISFYEIERIN